VVVIAMIIGGSRTLLKLAKRWLPHPDVAAARRHDENSPLSVQNVPAHSSAARTAVEQRLREELVKLQVEVNEERVGGWTSRKARASDFWALSSVRFAVDAADGCRCGRRA
jgi:hypothetical protein